MVTKGLKGQLEDLNSAIESPQNIAAERTQTTSESTKQPSDEQAKVRCCNEMPVGVILRSYCLIVGIDVVLKSNIFSGSEYGST